MSSPVLRCPACGAPDQSPEQGAGLHTCEHCGTRYRWSEAEQQGMVLAGQPARARVAVVTLASLVALGVGVAVSFALSQGSSSPVSVELSSGTAGGDPTVPPVMAKTVAAPEPPPPPTAELQVHGTVSGYRDSFYVLAELTSTSPYVLDRPRLTVVLLDEQGREVFQDDGYAALDHLAPGQSSPAKVLVKDPPPFADFQVELSLEPASWVPDLAQDLEVEALDPSVDSQGRYRVGGKVHNRGQQPAHFAEVLLVARDVDGTMLDLHHTYAAGQEALAAGDSARFSFDSLRYERSPATWEFLVTGRVAN